MQEILSSNRRNKILNYYDRWKKFFYQAVKNDLTTDYNIRKIATDQDDDEITGCLLDYPYFEEYCKLIATDLSKEPKLDADPKAIQKLVFTENPEEDNSTTFFIIVEAKEAKLDFHMEL